LEALGINLGYLLVQILNFTIVFVVLVAFAYKPLLGLLDKRRKMIAQGLEDAKIASEARQNAEQEAKEILAKAQADAALKVKEATVRADAAGKDIITQAENDAAKVRKDAEIDAQQERDKILSEVRGQIAALAMAATQKLVGASLDEKRQHLLIDEFFSGVKSGRVVVLEEKDVQGPSAEIISAIPLTEDEKNVIRQDILARVGSQTISFRVDPSILGGLVVKVGDKVLDGSVLSQIDSMRQSLR